MIILVKYLPVELYLYMHTYTHVNTYTHMPVNALQNKSEKYR